MQSSSQALQERVAGLEAALRRQDSAMEKLQAGAKRHMEASLRQGTARKSLQQAEQKEDKLLQQVTRLQAELTATRRSAPPLTCASLDTNNHEKSYRSTCEPVYSGRICCTTIHPCCC